MRRKMVIPATLRLLVIQRDNGRCRACGCADRSALQCDHIIPESKGGETSLDNLQALCSVCNNRKGITDIGELPIRQTINGSASYDSIMSDIERERSTFLEMLCSARQDEIVKLRTMVKVWRDNQVKGFIIRRRLEKIVEKRKVDMILRG